VGSLIRATNLWGYVDLVRELGGDPESLMARFDITPGVEHQPEAFVPMAPMLRLLETSAAELACPDFGLRLSRWQGLDILGPIAVIARNTSTMRDGWDAIARYLYVHSPSLQLTRVPGPPSGNLRFNYEMTELPLAESVQGYELSLGNAVGIFALLGGPEAHPLSVSFRHQQQGSDESYAKTLGCPVAFGQAWCGFELSPDVADRTIDSADPETRRIATMYLEANYPPLSAPLSERVNELIRRLLPTGHCTAEVIAEQLAMHPRTLQRRLSEEGVRCQDLIENERRDQATRYLAQAGLQLGQVAGLLGYAEQSTLNRSCRRWFGKTPRQYRAELV
jgi:AraC-like DNA-binding protein